MPSTKIQLFAFNPGNGTQLKDPNTIFATMTLSLDYNLDDFRQLEQSVLSHDLFINKVGQDLSGRVIELSIAGFTEVIHIANLNLPKILQPLEKIYLLSQNPDALNVSIEFLILNFLKICHIKGYDVISASELSWNYGD